MEIKKINNVVSIRKIKTKCPTCKKFSSNKFNPFCSKKCANDDLSKWLSDTIYLNLDSN